jgi:hypothetical protein
MVQLLSHVTVSGKAGDRSHLVNAVTREMDLTDVATGTTTLLLHRAFWRVPNLLRNSSKPI